MPQPIADLPPHMKGPSFIRSPQVHHLLDLTVVLYNKHTTNTPFHLQKYSFCTTGKSGRQKHCLRSEAADTLSALVALDLWKDTRNKHTAYIAMRLWNVLAVLFLMMVVTVVSVHVVWLNPITVRMEYDCYRANILSRAFRVIDSAKDVCVDLVFIFGGFFVERMKIMAVESVQICVIYLNAFCEWYSLV